MSFDRVKSIFGAAPSLVAADATHASSTGRVVPTTTTRVQTRDPASLIAVGAALVAGGYLAYRLYKRSKFMDSIFKRESRVRNTPRAGGTVRLSSQTTHRHSCHVSLVACVQEETLLKHVFATAREGDVESVIHTIDQFCHAGQWMVRHSRTHT
jgi:hypothetical protein